MATLPPGVKFVYGISKEEGSRGGRTKVQSVLFDKVKWSVDKAKEWLHEHNFLYGDVDHGGRKAEYMRFRQREPRGFMRMRTSNSPELVEMYLRRAVMAATRSYDDPDVLLNELQTTLEDIVYTVFEGGEE